jgi:two-component sensor histidine kinase
VSISKYLEKIGNSLRNFTLSDHSNIQLIVSSDSLKLSSTLAMCMGVIINEAVVNAVNHGFKENELGIIRVDFKMNKNQGKLHVFDNGVGYENIKTIASKGVKIMREMASHMNGEIDFDGRNGSNITVSFPLA